MQVFIKVVLISLSTVLMSCSNPFQARTPIPGDAKTIGEIYNQHQALTSAIQTRFRLLPDGDSDLKGYTREVNNELSIHFPRLPNPTIILYIFPHLSLEGTPVPGYSTVFKMYQKVEYALPGELLPQ